MPTHVKRIRGIFLSGHGSHAPTDVSSVQCRTKYHWITWNVSLTTVTKGWAWYMLGFFLGEGLKHWSNWTSVKIVNGFLDNKIGLEANYLVPFHTLCPYSIGYLQGSLSIFPGLYVSPVLVCSWHPGATAWPKVGKVGACITSSSEIAFSRPATFIPHILEQNKTCYRVNPVWHAPSAASSCKIEQCRVMIWYYMICYDMIWCYDIICTFPTVVPDQQLEGWRHWWLWILPQLKCSHWNNQFKKKKKNMSCVLNFARLKFSQHPGLCLADRTW